MVICYMTSNFFLKDSVFQCTLDQSYRDSTCNKSDLIVSYVDNSISSPNLTGKLTFSKQLQPFKIMLFYLQNQSK